jgi:hypothetical protein
VVAVSSLSRASGKRNPPLVLYSTQTYLKFRIQQDFIGKHRVWCSQVFDAEKQNPYELGSGQAPTSDPKAIFKDLWAAAVTKPDDHNAKITGQRTVLLGLAVSWCVDGLIAEDDRDEIVAIVQAARITEWRPLLFVIPFALVEKRVINVPRKDRASSEPEYIVPDLVTNEFDIIEVL